MTRSASPARRAGRPVVVARGAALVAAALLLAGCSGGQEPAQDPSPVSAEAPSSDASASGAASAPAGAAPGATVVTSMTTFSSPTGNISCYLAPVQNSVPYARCDLATANWTVQAPDDCEDGDWGGGGQGFGSVGVGGGAAEALCVSDHLADPSAPTLAYGSSITMDPLTCTSVSANTGMTCKNEKTGHGFTVRKEKVDLF